MDFTICGICGKKQKYRHSPTNLTQHLEVDHPLEYHAGSVNKSETMIDSFFTKSEKSKYKENHPKQKALKAKLVEWIVHNNRPLSVVEDKKLVEAFEIADEKFKMPTRKTIRNDIIGLFRRKKAEIVEEFSKIDYFSCTNDAGSSSGAKSFVDIKGMVSVGAILTYMT